MTDKVYELILEGAENGASSKEMIATLGTEKGLWKALNALKDEGKIFVRKSNGLQHYISAEYKDASSDAKEQIMTKKEFGGELQDALLDTIAKFSAGKVAEEVLPIVRKKCIEEFGMTPVVHEIKVGDSAAVKVRQYDYITVSGNIETWTKERNGHLNTKIMLIVGELVEVKKKGLQG